MPTFSIILLLFFSLFSLTEQQIHRRILHQPLYPLAPETPPESLTPPQTTPPKYPFTSTPAQPPPSATPEPFFPSYPSPLPPPKTYTEVPSSSTTLPANISSLVFPSGEAKKKVNVKVVVIGLVLGVLCVGLVVCLGLIVWYRKEKRLGRGGGSGDGKAARSDSLRLFSANVPPSDISNDGGGRRVRDRSSRPPSSGNNSNGNSREFLYLGTLVSNNSNIHGGGGGEGEGVGSPYRKLESPELHPLPPLSRQNVGHGRRSYRNDDHESEDLRFFSGSRSGEGEGEEDDEEEFYSPRGSVAEKESSSTPGGTASNSKRVFTAVAVGVDEGFESRSSNSSSPSYPTSLLTLPVHTVSSSASPRYSLSPKSLKGSRFPDLHVITIPPSPRQPPPPPPQPCTVVSRSSSPPVKILNHVENGLHVKSTFIPPPPPMPPKRYWETQAVNEQISKHVVSRAPVHITPTRPAGFQNLAALCPVESERSEDTPKPKLKPLHWDKVRASSDRAMVWDQLKSSSFQVNEEMIESLFLVNGATNLTPKENAWRPVFPMQNEENRVLDPKKSQNVAILLRALNVTSEEVCEALMEGNADTLGTDLLESLLKMAPSKEEERKLKDYKDDSPFKLGRAEKFLKAVLDIPFAFKRVNAMFCISNFHSEVEYLKKSFETLEVACEELRNSRMFLKLLEAVLKTGNRMNVGTNRGDAHAFKLDTLLKLADVKGADGKTTLLHFVIQEITKAEGSRLSGNKIQQLNYPNDIEFRKLGLQVVSGLSGDLGNVKKVAVMDSEVLSNDVSKLARGIANVGEVLRLNETIGLKESTQRFKESMNNFLKKAEEDIIRIQAQESVALSLVKEITEYFHGNSTKEEAHPFRIFLVVRDFLSVLDRVCKDVGKINERTVVSSARQFPVPVNPTQPPVFPIFNARPQYTSSDDESSSSSR